MKAGMTIGPWGEPRGSRRTLVGTCLGIAAIAFATTAAEGDTITVCSDGSGDYLTIQEGIDAASDGDEVVVCPATYNEVINFNGKAITLRSSDGPDITIIDGTDLNDSVVKCISGEGQDTVLEGFTITGGTGDPSVIPGSTVGGGIRCDGSSPAVADCTFIGNTCSGAEGEGGGMYNIAGNPSLTACRFEGNAVDRIGGAMFCVGNSSPVLVINCSFLSNTAGDTSGAMLVAHGDAVLVNCTFYGNSATYGGGLSIVNSTTTLVNSTFTANHPAAIWGDGATLANCILWGNEGAQIYGASTVTYSDIEGSWPGEGNIDADPLFVDPDNGDFHLSADSPCIDAGDTYAVPADVADLDGDGDTEEATPLDLDGRLRFADRVGTPDTGQPPWGVPVVDMGAYEYQCTGDLDGNGDIELADLALLLSSYGMADGASYNDGDLDQDGDVDLGDLARLLADYGVECE